MRVRGGSVGLAILGLASLAGVNLRAQQPAPAEDQHHHPASTVDADKHTEQEAVRSMTHGHHHEGPHLRLTASRPQTPEDLARADALVQALRDAVEKYKDYRVAIADGYRPFLPQLSQPQYHFTN